MKCRASSRSRFGFLLLLSLILITGDALAGIETPQDKAPAWTLTDLDGKPNSLNSYQGKIVVLNFWGTFCTPCIKEVPELTAIQQQFGNKGVIVVGASMDKNNDASVKAFAKRYFINYPLVIAPGFMLQSYGIVVAPVTFIINKQGLIVYKHVGALSRKELAGQIKPLL